MKRFWTFLIAMMLIVLPALGEEDELSIEELIEEVMLEDDGEEVPVEKSIYESDGSVLITVTATGDFTIGGDNYHRKDIFAPVLKSHDGDINFTLRNVKDILEADDLTIVNFEGTLTETKYVPASKKNNEFLFNIAPENVRVLTENGVEAVSLENNHVMDHGDEGYSDTIQTLEDAGIVWSNSTEVGVIEVKGVQIAMLSYLCIDRYEQLWDKVPADIAAAKEDYPIVIVSFHWGNEKDYVPTKNQIKMGRLAVDAGADLVLGHHSHRMNPIECYNGVYICYSLGNFCFAGNKKPSDMNSYLFQTRFRVKDDEVTNTGFKIIPISISSQDNKNDFTPTPISRPTTIDSVLTVLKTNGKDLMYAVEDYPLEWK